MKKKQVKHQTEPTDIKVESFLFMQSLNLCCACNQGSAGLTEILVTSSGFQRKLGVWRRFAFLPIHSVRQSAVRLTHALFTFSQLEGMSREPCSSISESLPGVCLHFVDKRLRYNSAVKTHGHYQLLHFVS